MTKIKMCGLFRDEDISFANEVKPDYIGFVFYQKSHRYVNKERAKSLREELDKDIKVVGVFVDEDISFIESLVEDKVIDIIQLHGHEDTSYVSKLKESPVLKNTPIIKAFQISAKTDEIALFDDKNVDYFLLDSGMGSGSSFDWNMIKDITKPFFLAGGLSPANINNALKIVSPFAVDVSSGIETDKIKDLEKMKSFALEVRRNKNE